MNLDGWEEIDDKSAEKTGKADPDPSPAYEDVVLRPRKANGPPRLHILGATWGGVNVTAEITALVSDDETLRLDTHTLHHTLQPDPAYGVVKTLTILYLYEGQGEVRVVNAPEYIPSVHINITPTAHEDESVRSYFSTLDGTTWRDGLAGQVEIMAVLYGPQKIRNPAVLQELARFFEGRRGQIRMTNGFFRIDPWVGYRKSWTVYFRFVNSKRVQCVTGMEDGALEIPWMRD